MVDSTSSFFNHKLDEESSKLTTFGTPYGWYRYLRMPMGALLSSDIYQYNVDGHLEGINNCVAIVDDIIIFGFNSDGIDHDKTVRQVMQKARKVGMRFNPTKCQFHQIQVKCFGLMLTREDVIPYPSKIEALRKLPEPGTENLLQNFLGIVNYLLRFAPKIVDLTHNLRGLLKKNNKFMWTSTHTADGPVLNCWL